MIISSGMDSSVLKRNSLITSKKFIPILVFTKIIPVSDMKTNCVKANTPMKNLEASDGEPLINKAGKYISANPATDAGAMACATSFA